MMMTVLGVHDGHDSGAALIHDGEIYAVNEERLTREKYHRGFPERSIIELFKLSGIEVGDVEVIAVSGIYRKKKRLLTMKKSLNELIGDNHIITVHHHRAHAAGAFFTSGFDNSVVLTIDAAGDGLSSAVYEGKEDELKKIAESSYLDSLGDFYASITELLGFKPMRHEGKVMALGAYYRGGDYHDFSDCIKVNGLGFDNLLQVTGSESVRELAERIDFPLNRRDECSDVLRAGNKDHELWRKAVKIAASAQNHLENLLEQLSQNIKKDDRIEEEIKENICYSGGVAQNVKANEIIKENFENTYVFPHMGDGGLALGAALDVQQRWKSAKKSWDWKDSSNNVYTGPEFRTKQIKNSFEKRDDLAYQRVNDKSEIVSSLLEEGEIVGLFQGKMEYGPRALGNRSILGDPSRKEIKKKLNNMLGREPFQPFSPTILKEYEDDYLKSSTTNKFMTLSYDITEKAKEDLKAAVHVDNTCRPQVLERKDNPVYYDMIKRFEEKTGIGALLNTSFNLHGEPIVCSPKEAINSFTEIDLDALICENYLIQKDNL